MKKNDFTNLQKYHNEWVAIKEDDGNKVVGIGKTLIQALDEAKQNGVENPILTRVPSDYGAFVLQVIMKFDYLKFPSIPTDAFPDRKWIARPVLPITLKKDGKEIKIQGLVDSGADHNIFDAEVGEALGLDIKKGEKWYFFGSSSQEKQLAYYHDIIIEVGGHEQECYCGFSYDIKHLPYGLLGQNDFFKKFKIIFDYSKERFELK